MSPPSSPSDARGISSVPLSAQADHRGAPSGARSYERVVLLDELWLTEDAGQLVLGLPTVTSRSTGVGVPALVTPRPLRVFRPGEVLTLADPPPCGCSATIQYSTGAVLQHTCGRGW